MYNNILINFGRIVISYKSFKHTEETKALIRKRRNEYLEANPDKVPYLLNHSSKGPSYPEKYFKKVFDNEGLIYTEQFQVGLYALDFAILNRMVDIEVHGSQHYYDKKIVASDIRRRAKLTGLGWLVIEINWSDYQKLSKDEKTEYVKTLMEAIDNRAIIDVPAKPILTLHERDIKDNPIISCECCGKETKNIKYCSLECSSKKKKIKKTDKEIYDILVENKFNYEKTGRELNVSGNTIKRIAARTGNITKNIPPKN